MFLMFSIAFIQLSGYILHSSHKSQLQITHLAHNLDIIPKCLTNCYNAYKMLQSLGQDRLAQHHKNPRSSRWQLPHQEGLKQPEGRGGIEFMSQS
ncbi:Uncharacterized protein HZ326_15557 [Fusarium oxysporum f. sp. albedinis]|nr:Uncharacterized protein HZ326_15557 [Fusarium oxysporum f. sp. albedinis]